MNEYIGIDIGGTKTAIVRGDENGTILEKKRFATTTKEETLEMIFQSVADLKTDQTKAIGVSCGGPLNSRTGVILGPPNLPAERIFKMGRSSDHGYADGAVRTSGIFKK